MIRPDGSLNAWRMMAFVLLALFLQAGAHAQIVHPPIGVAFVRGDCEANPVGTGTYSKRITSVAGYTGEYWWCPRESIYALKFVVLVKRNDYQIRWPENHASMNQRSFIEALWAANKPADCMNLAATGSEELEAICKATYAAAETDVDRPRQPIWSVSSNGLIDTRPVYTGTRLGAGVEVEWRSIAGMTVKVGDLCACHVMAVRVGTATRCPLASGATVERAASPNSSDQPDAEPVRLRVFAQCSAR